MFHGPWLRRQFARNQVFDTPCGQHDCTMSGQTPCTRALYSMRLCGGSTTRIRSPFVMLDGAGCPYLHDKQRFSPSSSATATRETPSRVAVLPSGPAFFFTNA